MPTYSVNAINVGSFNLGESDKIITLFSAERGLIRAVAKGARKPGAKIGGRAEVLAVNRLLIAKGRSLDIITQAESVETFKTLRNDLTRLSYALYYAELTCHLGQGVSEDPQLYFETLVNALRQLANLESNPTYLCLIFQLSLLHLLGLKPELDSCVLCRKRLIEHDLSVFHHDLGGTICDACFSHNTPASYFTYLTPLVWKKLILAGGSSLLDNAFMTQNLPTTSGIGQTELIEKTILAARHLLETYIEHRSGRKMKALGLI